MLLYIALNLRNFLVKLLNVFLLMTLLGLQMLLLFFFLFTEGLVFAYIVLQVGLVVLELLCTINKGLVAALLLFFKLCNLLVHGVVGEFGEEHLFLLIDELVDILSTLLSWELHSTPGNVHCLVDMILLLEIKILFLWIMLLW